MKVKNFPIIILKKAITRFFQNMKKNEHLTTVFMRSYHQNWKDFSSSLLDFLLYTKICINTG